MEKTILVNDLIYDMSTHMNIERNRYRNAREMLADSVKTSDVKTGPKGGRYIIVTENDDKGNPSSKKVYLPKQ